MPGRMTSWPMLNWPVSSSAGTWLEVMNFTVEGDENACAVELAAMEQHLGEAIVIFGCGNHSSAAGGIVGWAA